jgi:drug/metabolite transporter (DMT)-like permease
VAGRYLLALAGLSALWGSGFLFNRVAVQEMPAPTLIGLRMAVGGITLLPIVLVRYGAPALWRTAWEHRVRLVVVAVLGSAIAPGFTAWAQNRLDTGTTAIIAASAPLFATLLSILFARHDVKTGWRLVGLLVGFGGVALLVGAQPSGSVLSAGSVVLGAVAFALSTVLAGRWLGGIDPLLTTFLLTTISAVAMVPFDVLGPPGGLGNWQVAGSILGLGVAVTGIGFVAYYWLVAGAGASNSILAAYLIPAFALLYGAILLDEPLEASALAGFGIVIVGVALATGSIRLPRSLTRRRGAPVHARRAGREGAPPGGRRR